MAQSIGILYSERSNSGLAHAFFAPIIDEFKNTIEKKGYNLIFINITTDNDNRETYMQQIKRYDISGVLMINMYEETDELKEIFDSHIPIINLDNKTPGTINVSSDNIKAITDLVYYLYEMGHKKIAFIAGDERSAVTKIRIDTFLDVTSSLKLDIKPEYIRKCFYRDMDLTARIVEELLALNDPPTCILCPDDYAAIGGINIIRARGLEIPNDISICGFDGIKLVGCFNPKLTTIAQNVRKMGTVCGEKIIEMIENNIVGDGSEIIVPAELVKGETVKRIY